MYSFHEFLWVINFTNYHSVFIFPLPHSCTASTPHPTFGKYEIKNILSNHKDRLRYFLYRNYTNSKATLIGYIINTKNSWMISLSASNFSHLKPSTPFLWSASQFCKSPLQAQKNPDCQNSPSTQQNSMWLLELQESS